MHDKNIHVIDDNKPNNQSALVVMYIPHIHGSYAFLPLVVLLLSIQLLKTTETILVTSFNILVK